MLVEIKAKVTRVIDGKYRHFSETYLKDAEVFAEAEYAVMHTLEEEGISQDSYEIVCLRISPIKELLNQRENEDEHTYVASLKASYEDDNGNVKTMRYKTLLWADSLIEANTRAGQYSRQGYDMAIESITEKEYTVL